MKPAAFAPSARAEFEAAAEWYESHASGLGDEFVDCVDEIVGRIGRSPREFPTWAGDRRFRRAVAQDFRTSSSFGNYRMASRWWQLPTPPGNRRTGSSASSPPNGLAFSSRPAAEPAPRF